MGIVDTLELMNCESNYNLTTLQLTMNMLSSGTRGTPPVCLPQWNYRDHMLGKPGLLVRSCCQTTQEWPVPRPSALLLGMD